MCQALMEIMKPEIDAAIDAALLQERNETKRKIKETVFGFYLLKSALPNWIKEKMEEIRKIANTYIKNCS